MNKKNKIFLDRVELFKKTDKAIIGCGVKEIGGEKGYSVDVDTFSEISKELHFHDGDASFDQLIDIFCLMEAFAGKSYERREYEEPVKTDITLSDVVLPDEIKESVGAIMTEKKYEEKFYDEWDMQSVVGNRRGLNVLFSGPPGTGKTMTAKALSNHLDQELYIIRFEELVNVWYGQTEKNVKKLFEKLDENGGIILLDEADAILKKRSSNRGGTNATENRIVNIFLQGMEDHSGIVVMTTNLAVNMDGALNRRIDIKVEFPVPDAEARERIWMYHLPDKLPLGDDVDLKELAERYEFTGGSIRNAAFNAARNALHAERDVVTKEDFKAAIMKEKEGEKAMKYSLQDDGDEMLKGYK